MCNLIEYSKNYSKKSGSLWNYYKSEGNINYSIKDSKSFEYKTKITGKLEDDDAEKNDIEIVVPLKIWATFGEN